MNNNSVSTVDIVGNDYGARKFLYNNAIMLIQACISVFGLAFSATMLLTGNDAGIYLPVMTSIIFFWCPSPIGHKIEQPSGIPQVRDLLSRNLNNV